MSLMSLLPGVVYLQQGQGEEDGHQGAALQQDATGDRAGAPDHALHALEAAPASSGALCAAPYQWPAEQGPQGQSPRSQIERKAFTVHTILDMP